MATTITTETLRLVRLALYQLRQDIGVPETVAAATDDTSVTWRKCRELFDIAFAEVLEAHNWTWKRAANAGGSGEGTTPPATEAPDLWPDDAKNALVYCLARELAVPVAGRTADLKNCHQLYQQKLAAARIHDLEGEVAAVTDKDVKEVLAAVCPTLLSNVEALPMDLLSVTRRIDANAANARAEILASHNWSFARDELVVSSCTCTGGCDGYPFKTELPAKCVRPLECYGMNGIGTDWKLVGQTIRSVYPIATILYIRDVEKLDRWPALVRAAYTSLLAADIALTVVKSSSEAQRQRELYERNLETAKLADSRGTGSRREVYGRNFYADAMAGRGGMRDGGRGMRYGEPCFRRW